MASVEAIYIYQPSFPDQSLPEKPVLILYPPVSGPNLSHYLDNQNPHSINRLHVDYLGHEEIILVVCDDGDVIGYHVSSIQWEIERRIRQEESEADNEDEDDEARIANVRTFFHRNVESSAWGLAVHREARLIAISANTALVTVISFALTDPSSSELEPGDNLYHDDMSIPDSGRPHRVITLLAHSNIPSVSFDNHGTDPSGRWLFSCVIDGKAHLWDLQRPHVPARTYQLGCCLITRDPTRAPPPHCPCGQYAHGVWGAMFLDPRASHRCTEVKDAFGVVPRRFRPYFLDNTEAKLARPSGIGLFNPYAADSEDESDSGDEVEEAATEAHTEETSDDSDEEGTDSVNTNPAIDNPAPGSQAITEESSSQTLGYAFQTAESTNAQGIHNDTDSETDTDTDTDDEGLFVAELDAAVAAASQTISIPGVGEAHIDPHNFQNLQTLVQGDEGDSGEDDDEDIYDVHEIFDQIGGVSRSRRPRKKAYCETHDTGRLGSESYLPPSVIITKEEIYLLQPFYPTTYPTSSPPPEPIIVMRNPGYPDSAQMPNHDRQCYSAQIPELGIFIVASPNGRCSIFSFTQISTPGGASGGNRKQTVYGFKQDYVLPTVEQEASGDWMSMQYTQLVGISVGPIQGMLDKMADLNDNQVNHQGEEQLKNRRWRLMMLYRDHTVLSYELSRGRVDAEPTVANLVV